MRCHGCSKCNRGGSRGATGPTGATGTTGGTGGVTPGTGIFAVSHLDQTLTAGDPLLAEDVAIFNPSDIAYAPGTGIVTFNSVGLYLVHYGFRTAPGGIISGAVLPQQNGVTINAATTTFSATALSTVYEKSFLTRFAVGNMLQFVNDGSGQIFQASPSAGGHVGTSFFFTASRIGS